MSGYSTLGAVVALSLCSLAFPAHSADRSRIVNEGGIKDQWMLADGLKLAVPGYPAGAQGANDSVCVAIGYSISPEGKTGDFTLLKSWTSAAGEVPEGYYDPYSAAAAGALSQWAFKPRPEVEKPKRTVTVATMSFRGKDGMDPAALRAHCQISDLATALQEAGHKNADRDVMRRDMERWSRGNAANASMVSNPGAAQGAPTPSRP